MAGSGTNEYFDAEYLQTIRNMLAPVKKRLFQEVVAAAQRPDATVLDIGCGTGADLHELANLLPRARFIGVDVQPEMVKLAGKDAPANVTVQESDAAALSLEDASCDVIYMDRVVQHFNDAPAGLAEVSRVLRPGGSVVVAETDWLSFWHSVPENLAPALDRMLAAMFCSIPSTTHAVRRLPDLLGRSGLQLSGTNGETIVLSTPAELATVIQLYEKEHPVAGVARAHVEDARYDEIRRYIHGEELSSCKFVGGMVMYVFTAVKSASAT